jgi:hypothetical protein
MDTNGKYSDAIPKWSRDSKMGMIMPTGKRIDAPRLDEHGLTDIGSTRGRPGRDIDAR